MSNDLIRGPTELQRVHRVLSQLWFHSSSCLQSEEARGPCDPSWGREGAGPGLPGSAFPTSSRRDHISNTFFFFSRYGRAPARGQALSVARGEEGTCGITGLGQLVDIGPLAM